MMVYGENFHSRKQVFHYIENFSTSFSNSFPYMGVNLWYVSRLAETYTHIPDIYRSAMIVMTL
jgi:hypothetical protein